jgi:hypothetical protein
MENIIDKLTKTEDDNSLNNWSLEEKKKLLDIYLIISKNETHIFNLIYQDAIIQHLNANLKKNTNNLFLIYQYNLKFFNFK